MIICADDRLRQGPGRWNSSDLDTVYRQCWRDFKAALQDPEITTAGIVLGCPGSGKSTWAAANDSASTLLWDGVWDCPGKRTTVAEMVRKAGKTPVAVMVLAPVDIAAARNNARPDWRRVPDRALRDAFWTLRVSPPRRCEGWARLDFTPTGHA